MKSILITIGCYLLFSIVLFSCTKTKNGNITFWISYSNGCGPITVSIDGTNVGTIAYWQANPPSNCTGSNTLLNVATTQGTKNVTFKNNCKTWTTTINLAQDCYIYMVF